MNRIRHIRRLAAALTGLVGALLALAAVAPPALAQSFPPRPPGWDKHPPVPPSHWDGPVNIPVRTVVIGGMPGWQIALIAAGAALFAATVAVLLTRAWAARRKVITDRPTVPAEQESRAVSRP
jgi:hypothetical protein